MTMELDKDEMTKVSNRLKRAQASSRPSSA